MASITLPKLPFREIYTTGRQLLPGSRMNAYAGLLTSYAEYTALAGGTLVTATPVLNAANANLTVVANANDSVCLPPAKAGLTITVVNNGAASAQIFASGTDTVAGAAGNVGVALANGATAMYKCIQDGVWKRFVAA